MLRMQYKLTHLKPLSQGVYGRVYAARARDQARAVKVMAACALEDDAETVRREVQALSTLRGHPNIIRLHDVHTCRAPKCIVMEMADGDLHHLMRTRTATPRDVISIVCQLLRGLAEAQKHMLVHRDLKPANILTFKSGRVAIGDWGMSRHACADKDTPQQCTRWYRSIEILLEGNAIPKSDVWSVGCIMYELILHRALFPESSEIRMIKAILHYFGAPTTLQADDYADMPCLTTFVHAFQPTSIMFPFHETQITSDQRALMIKLMAVLPRSRLSASEALDHAYFDQVRELSIESLCKWTLHQTQETQETQEAQTFKYPERRKRTPAHDDYNATTDNRSPRATLDYSAQTSHASCESSGSEDPNKRDECLTSNERNVTHRTRSRSFGKMMRTSFRYAHAWRTCAQATQTRPEARLDALAGVSII